MIFAEHYALCAVFLLKKEKFIFRKMSLDYVELFFSKEIYAFG